MATSSPGVYFNEIDRTTYMLPQSVSTGVAMVGYATKGDVGVPTLISSYSKFRETFGGPTEIANSAIAARSVLNVCDNLIFVRVADNTVSPSNTVIKNGVPESYGRTRFNNSTDIMKGTANYHDSSIYVFEAKSNTMDPNEPGKVFYIRSPYNAKLTQASILSQIINQIPSTPGTFEVKCGTTDIIGGMYSFHVVVDGKSVFGDDPEDDDNIIFIQIPPAVQPIVLVDALERAIADGSNATCTLEVVENFNEAVGIVRENTVYAGADGSQKYFNLNIDGENRRISLALPASDEFTYANLRDFLDNTLYNQYGVKVYFQEGKMENTTVAENSKFIFVRRDKGPGKSVNIFGTQVDIDQEYNDDDLFAVNPYTDNEVDGIYEPETNSTSVAVVKKEIKGNIEPEQNLLSVSYNTNTRSIIFATNATGPNHTIEVKEATLGNFIFGNSSRIGTITGSVEGQGSIDLVAYRDSETKAITFESINGIDAPSIYDVDNLPAETPYINFLQLMDDVSEIPGDMYVDAAYRDIIVITTLQKGSDTGGIMVRKNTIANPVTDQIRHTVEVWQDGVLKEAYDNVSMDFADVENRFDTRINNTPENGGSNLIQVEVIKNDYSDPIIQWKNGEYLIGEPNKEGDVLREQDVSPSAYHLYDYSVGTDGIPEDGSSLFEDALDIDAPLSNIDLYNYHILITPDDISTVVQDAAIKLADYRKDFLYLVDPPFGLSPTSVRDWHNGKGFGRGAVIDSTYAALYWPWVKIYDNDNRRYSWVPPSTMMAAKLVQLDNTRGCWYAPAGETNGRFNVGDIEYSAKQVERDDLYTNFNRVNPIIKYNDGSVIIYGEKTLSRMNSTLTKVHTRRMLIDLKKKVRAALRPFLFLPNIPSNWAKCTALINAILEVYKVGGGLTFYKTTIDATTTTAELMQQDVMKGVINLVPAGVIEMVVLDISLDKSEETIGIEG